MDEILSKRRSSEHFSLYLEYDRFGSKRFVRLLLLLLHSGERKAFSMGQGRSSKSICVLSYCIFDGNQVFVTLTNLLFTFHIPLQYEDPNVVEQRFGLILTGLLYLLIGFPMIGLKDVIRERSTASLPFPLIFMGFIVSLAWFVYGIILNSMFVILQNLIAVLLSGFQLSFFLIYPSKSNVTKGKKKN